MNGAYFLKTQEDPPYGLPDQCKTHLSTSAIERTVTDFEENVRNSRKVWNLFLKFMRA